MCKVKRWSLVAAALVLLAAIVLTRFGARTVRADDYETKREAAVRMQRCMDRIKEYKAERSLPVGAEDLHQTGLIGEPFTGITTTLGAIEAKRTAADANMAALLVELLHEAGISAGDTVGAGFSGSFPGLNLAVLCACAAMDVELIYIDSVGASTFGANQPALTFPDMAYLLAQDGLLPQYAKATTLGGQGDAGLGMEPALREEILSRLRSRDVPLLLIEDYAANVNARMAIYEENGPIDCFIGVGGNVTTLGRGETQLSYGLIAPHTVSRADERSGLLEHYNAQGLPVLYLLNVKQLVTDYGMEYDPATPLPVGQGAVYFQTEYPWAIAVAGALLAVLALLLGRRQVARETRAELRPVERDE